MSSPIRIKRRAAGGAAGAPTSLQNAELAYNESDSTLYYGEGTGGEGGTATVARPIGGPGAMVTLTTDQTISGDKTFTGDVVVPEPTEDEHAATKAYVDSAVGNAGGGDMMKSTYDSNNNGKVDVAETAEAVAWADVTGKPSTFAPSAHTHDDRYYTETEVDNLLGAKAPLESPALTGTPTAPTQAGGNNSTRIATTAFVQSAIQSVIGAAPEALDTLAELAASLGDDANFASTVTSAIGEKLAKSSNLSDLTNAATARSNLGLGSIATQNANNVAITGGTIDGVTIDGGTF